MLSATQLSQMLETAVVAARLAGQRALEELSYVSRSMKNGVELVTQADPICQKIIIDQIRQSFPDHGFLGEEGLDGKFLKMPPRDPQMPVWWVIDPIDGTNNYANGILNFTVSIAAMVRGKPVVGVVFEPATESMFTALENEPAFFNTKRVSVNEDPISKLTCFGIDSNVHPALNDGVRKIMELTRIRALGSTALHLAYVAKGGFIGSITVFSKLWDIAAGALLVQQAGGIVSDLSGKPLFPIDLEAYHGQECPTLTATPTVYRQILSFFGKNE